MDESEFKNRTKNLALHPINFVESLPEKQTGKIIGKQLLRPATLVGVNYRAVCRSKSVADLINKLSIVEEADNSLYQLEISENSKFINSVKLSELKSNTDQIASMIVASVKTLRLCQSQLQNLKS